MRTLIYYFTGTGNSLAVARDLASRMDAELVSIVAIKDSARIRPDARRIGFVFPVYHHGVPGAVRRFVERMEGLEACELFAVCTYGDTPGVALMRFAETVERAGGRLGQGHEVRMPYNYILSRFPVGGLKRIFSLRETSLVAQKEMFWVWAERRVRVLEDIELGGNGKGRGQQSVKGLAMRTGIRHAAQTSLWLKAAGYKGKKPATFDEAVALMDHGFWSDDNCTGCATCQRVCPVGNIRMEKERPVWNHRCEQCFACLHWCPQSALQFGEATEGKSRYHHPEVNLLDILSRLEVAQVQQGAGEIGPGKMDPSPEEDGSAPDGSLQTE